MNEEKLKKALEEATEISNFCQWFKTNAWEIGFKGEDKLDEFAIIIFKYFK